MSAGGELLPPSAVDVDLSGVAWGADRTMSDLETGMWRMEEVRPYLRSPIVAVDLLDRAPDWERLVAAHEWASHIVPRIRMRVLDPAPWFTNPVWSVDPEFDLDYHLRRVRLPEPATFDHALRMCRHLATEPFDRARPPWNALLIEGLEDGRAVYVAKTHHSMTDGLGGIALMTLLHSRRAEPSPGKPDRPPPPPEKATAWSVWSAEVGRQVRKAPALIEEFTRAAIGAVTAAATAPAAFAGDVWDYANSVRRVATPPPGRGAELMAARGMGRWFGALDVTLADMKAAARTVGGSVNDAYVAALLGGIGRYQEELGYPIASIPVGMPVSVRSESDGAGGNHFAAARFTGPVDIRDPAERMKKVRAIVLSLRDEPALDVLEVIAPLLVRVPTRLLASWYLSQSTAIDLQASNVAGVPVPVYLAGARIERMYPFGPAPGCAVMATLVSHVGVCCIGVNLDTAAVTRPALFMSCLQESLDEIVELGRKGGR